ncbi:MAG: hydrolase [Gemmatimonadota bacterium]|nr:MAG: hydrolase [Gemmatimonadota bacterium]
MHDAGPRQLADFHPAWWIPGGHGQTVWNRTLRRVVKMQTCRARWTTPDGDFLDIDFLDGPLASPQLLLLHGLEGSSERKYVRGLLSLAADRGWRGAALNFRSCGGASNRTPRLYHSGDTGDLDWVISELVKRDPGAPIVSIGVSLGGNVLLKWLGEQGDLAAEEVAAAVAISTPFDLAAAANKMSKGLGRFYSGFFLRTLKAKALLKAEEYPGLLDRDAILRARDWREYDDAVTAPLHGFRGAEDYWRRSSSLHFLTGIRRPTLLINARDDPFIPESSLPEESVSGSPWLESEFTSRGGHAGFIAGALPWRPIYWAERRAIEFLTRFVPALRP